MKNIPRELFKAVHEGLWLTIEYKNLQEQVTHYWIAVKDIDPAGMRIRTEAMHLGRFTLMEANLYYGRILRAEAVEGTWYPVNEELCEDIRINPEKYASIFSSPANLRILSYYSECYRLDSTPYRSEHPLIDRLDDETFSEDPFPLDDIQFAAVVTAFQKDREKKNNTIIKNRQIGMNVLSINTPKGLYLLAWIPLRLDVVNRTLRKDSTVCVNREYTLDGIRVSATRFLDQEYLWMLDEIDSRLEEIRQVITETRPELSVDDMPYIVEVGRTQILDLEKEYDGIQQMFSGKGHPTDAMNAFFGRLQSRPRRRQSYPLVLSDSSINLDQLLAMNHAMRMPVSYVQGPPGTGKTKTIISILITAFFNRKTVLFTSYNNHPIDEVYAKLTDLYYRGNPVPLPAVRLGNNDETLSALKKIRELMILTENSRVYDNTLEKNFQEERERASRLSALLESYDEKLDLEERKETIAALAEANSQMNFVLNLQTYQTSAIDRRLEQLGEIRMEDAAALTDRDSEGLMKYLYYSSIRSLQKLKRTEYREFRDILKIQSDEEMVNSFNRWLSIQDNLNRFLKVFPLVLTTCISARRLGEPKPAFDMVIMDEASQCSTAVSLVPIIRGKSMMLVGDPQQLKPVILLDRADNEALKKKYRIPKEYDYIDNSVYQTFLASDAVSDEILLSHHYRCDPKIITFNNRKYYNNRLQIMTASKHPDPLVFVDMEENESYAKNTAWKEAQLIAEKIKHDPDRKYGIITPFVAQKELIQDTLKQYGIDDVTCGTIHAFQGDEKDVILFSLALSEKTRQGTYDWLKNFRELINVAVSRAKEQLIVFGSMDALERLHIPDEQDDLYEFVRYVAANGSFEVSPAVTRSRALGIKPYSTATEEAFLQSLNHALDNAFADGSRYTVHRQVPLSQVFTDSNIEKDYYFRGRFDFVIYQKQGNQEFPVLAIELDGPEHLDDDVVRKRDKKKEEICRAHGFSLIRVENSYARRYHYIKDILIRYFTNH